MFLRLALVALGCAMCSGDGPILLYTTKNEVRSTDASQPSKVSTIARGLEKGSAVDFYHRGRQVCWTDFELEKIKCVSNDRPTFSVSGCSSYGLAVDWYTQKLYWTDRDALKIEVASLAGDNHRKVLFWSDLDEPRAIVVAPSQGLLFWSDWGEMAKIERAAMDGEPSTRRVIVDTNVFWPNAITVDYQTDRLYWLDAKLLFIDVMDFDGGNRSTIMNGELVYAVSLSVFRDKLYWADWKTWTLYSWDINTKGPVKNVIVSETEPTDVKVWDAERQPKPTSPHPCSINNGNCTHLCLLSSSPPGYSCACPTGIKLINKYECADSPQSQIILVQKMAISRISLDSPDYTSFALPLKDIKNAVTVAYESVNGFIYWIDSDPSTISRSQVDGSNQSVVIQGGLGNPDGIAVDSVAGNIYWTDASLDTITVARLDGTYRMVIINENLTDPRAIALAPTLGWMFWSDWSNHNIERASLDGTERMVLVSKDIAWPNGIALDVKMKKVYWGDGYFHKIEVCNMDGSDRRELLSDNLHHIFGVALLGNYLYWTDWQRRSLSRVHKVTGEEREMIAEHFYSVMGITTYDLNDKLEVNPCFYNNGNCSHFCFNRPKDFICGCPIGLEFGKDNKTCVKPAAFLLYARKDKIGRLSIENSNNHVILPVKDIKEASTIAVHVSAGHIYWADPKIKSIGRCAVNGSNSEKVIEWTYTVEGLAIDWCGRNLFWTDSTTQRIEVSKLNGASRKTLIWHGLKKPKSIALDPVRGYMYWSEWAKTIKRAGMDGSRPTILIDQAGRTNALNIDYEKQRLIWVTFDPSSIQMANLDGTGKTTLISEMKTTFALTLDNNYLYWTDLDTGDVESASINMSNRSKLYSNLEDISALVVYHESRQLGENPCSVNNGGCSHLCLAIPLSSNSRSRQYASDYKCACPTHHVLNKDNHTCNEPTEFIMFSHRNGIGRVITDTPDCPDAPLPLIGMKSVKAIEYDSIHKNVYWIDGRTHSIRYTSENGSSEVTIVVKNLVSTVDMALDAIGRAIFFVCPESDSINVTKLDDASTSIGVVIHGDGIVPKFISIHQSERLLFWANIAKGTIMSSSMDGSNSVEIAQAPNITALTVDPYSNFVYWANAKRIYASSLDGSNKTTIWRGGTVMSLAVLRSTLYWIDNEKQLMNLPLNEENAPALSVSRFYHITDVVAVYKVDMENPCKNGGNCAGVCLEGGACGCVRGLLSQGRCSLPPPCGAKHFACTPNQSPHSLHFTDKMQTENCIPIAWRCDGQNDCPDASDEFNCNKCPDGKYKCLDDKCIHESQVCDGIKHCTDGHDESHCCSEPRSFRCSKTGVCINSNFLCDQINHCADSSDESPTICTQNQIESSPSNVSTTYIIGFVVTLVCTLFAFTFFYCRKRMLDANNFQPDDKAADPLSPKQPSHSGHKTSIGCPSSAGNNSKTAKMGMKLMDSMRMSGLNGSSSNSYDRNHITGASSSATNGSSFVGRYPREPLNPPPSPATTAPSSSAPSRHRPYRHYRVINQPPPPTPCSTDVCDESDCTISYPTLGFGMYLEAPPPTPCPPSPPSPSSRSSTYFSPLPPPPSPVPHHHHYDS